MIEPKLLATALSQKSPSGHPAFTKSQIADIAIKEDSFLGQKIQRAMDLGVTKEQAIKYFAFGSANGSKEVEQPKKSFFDRFIQPTAQTIVDYGTAPGRAVGGAIDKGVGALMGKDVSQMESVKNLPQNLSRSADLARVGIPVAAGLATGGASIPVSAAISGIAGAGGSLIASGLEAAAGEDQSLGGAIGEAATMGAVNAGLDAATMGLFRLAKPLLKAKGLKQLSKDAFDTAGKIVQGTDDEIKVGQKALQTIDTTGVKTYSDLKDTISSKIKSLITEQDALLNTMPARYTLNQLGTTVRVGEKEATDNFVKSALNGLEELYTKTGNTEGLLKIQAIKEVAEDPLRGLTVRQINDIAREYGRGFKAFSDATGQPLTSVNAKLYETVRKGIKNVSRKLMPNEASKVIDEEMSNLIKTEELISDMNDAVRKLSNKVTMRPLGDRIGSFIGKITNALSFNTLGGFVKGTIPSNEGMKQLNSLAIQKHLPANLAKLSKLIEQMDSLSETQILGRMKEIFGDLLEGGTKAAIKTGAGFISNSAND